MQMTADGQRVAAGHSVPARAAVHRHVRASEGRRLGDRADGATPRRLAVLARLALRMQSGADDNLATATARLSEESPTISVQSQSSAI